MANEWLVITNRNSWGASTTEDQARKNAFANNYQGKRACEFVVYHFPDELVSDFGCDAMGSAWWKWRGDITREQREACKVRQGVYRRKGNGQIERTGD